MTHKDIYTKFMIEYDKANITSSYPSLTPYEVATILDKAYLALIARKLTGNNPRLATFESDIKSIEDLRPLITNKPLVRVTSATVYADNETVYTLPSDMLYYLEGQVQYNKATTSLDKKQHRNELVNLVNHDLAQRFKTTNSNLPWIKQPVSFIESQLIHLLIDLYKHKDDTLTFLATYLKKPAKFANSVDPVFPSGSSSSETTTATGSITAVATSNLREVKISFSFKNTNSVIVKYQQMNTDNTYSTEQNVAQFTNPGDYLIQNLVAGKTYRFNLYDGKTSYMLNYTVITLPSTSTDKWTLEWNAGYPVGLIKNSDNRYDSVSATATKGSQTASAQITVYLYDNSSQYISLTSIGNGRYRINIKNTAINAERVTLIARYDNAEQITLLFWVQYTDPNVTVEPTLSVTVSDRNDGTTYTATARYNGPSGSGYTLRWFRKYVSGVAWQRASDIGTWVTPGSVVTTTLVRDNLPYYVVARLYESSSSDDDNYKLQSTYNSGHIVQKKDS